MVYPEIILKLGVDGNALIKQDPGKLVKNGWEHEQIHSKLLNVNALEAAQEPNYYRSISEPFGCNSGIQSLL